MTYGYTNRQDCNDFGFGQLPAAQGGTNLYATEHILEVQLVPIFFDEIFSTISCPNPTPGPDFGTPADLCQCMNPLWYELPGNAQPTVNTNGQQISMDPIDFVGSVFPGSDNPWRDEFVLLESDVNSAKEKMWGRTVMRDEANFRVYIQSDPDTAIKNLKDVMSALRYHADPTISNRLVTQKNRIGDMLNRMDTQVVPGIQRFDANNQQFGQWQPKGLQQRWNTWIRGRADLARTRAFAHIEKYLGELVSGWTSDLQRQDALNKANQGDQLPLRRINKIDMLRNEWNTNRPVWNNPF